MGLSWWARRGMWWGYGMVFSNTPRYQPMLENLGRIKTVERNVTAKSLRIFSAKILDRWILFIWLVLWGRLERWNDVNTATPPRTPRHRLTLSLLHLAFSTHSFIKTPPHTLLYLNTKHGRLKSLSDPALRPDKFTYSYPSTNTVLPPMAMHSLP